MMSKTVQPLPRISLHLAIRESGTITPLNPLAIELPALDSEWIGPKLQAAIEQLQSNLQQQVDAIERKRTFAGRLKTWFKRQ